MHCHKTPMSRLVSGDPACVLLQTFEQCLNVGKEYCGWCVSNQTCIPLSMKGECEEVVYKEALHGSGTLSFLILLVLILCLCSGVSRADRRRPNNGAATQV